MQYIRGDRECGILLWFLSQYCNFGCFQSKTPLTNLFPKADIRALRQRTWHKKIQILCRRWNQRYDFQSPWVPGNVGRYWSRIDRTIYCQDKGRFWAFSFPLSGFWRACHILIFPHWETPLRERIGCFPSLHMEYPHLENPDVANLHMEKPHGENPAQ